MCYPLGVNIGVVEFVGRPIDRELGRLDFSYVAGRVLLDLGIIVLLSVDLGVRFLSIGEPIESVD